MNSEACGVAISSPKSEASPGAQPHPAQTRHDGAVSGQSDALAQNLTRLQKRQAERLNREEQERLALLREKARLD